MKKFSIVIALIAIGVAAYIWWTHVKPAEAPIVNEPGGLRLMSVEDYVTQNISTLSPVKEVLGGKFYVTKIEAHGGAGTVYYEDGHNAYTADFTYNASEQTGYTITSFVVRK